MAAICAADQKVERSVLFEYTRVHPSTHLSDVVVFKDYLVNRRGNMRQSSEIGWADWGNALDRRIMKRGLNVGAS